MLSASNVQIRPPIPNGVLINDASNTVANTTLKFQPGKTYKVRVINMSALASVILLLDSHVLKIIEVDGEYVQEKDAKQIYIAPAQRYSFLVEAKADTSKNYAFLAVFDVNPDFRLPQAVFPFNATAYVEYDAAKPLPAAPVAEVFDLLDDFTLKVSGACTWLLIRIVKAELFFSRLTTRRCTLHLMSRLSTSLTLALTPMGSLGNFPYF